MVLIETKNNFWTIIRGTNMESNPINKKQLILLSGDVLRIFAEKPVLITFSFEDIPMGDLDYTISDDKSIKSYGTNSK